MKATKRFLIVPFLIVLLCLSACSAPVSKPVDTTGATPTDSVSADSKPTETQPKETEPEVFEPEPGYFPIPAEPATFSFLSGAGGWRTDMDINTDGTFYGKYQDGEMGASGEGYNATYYVCEFSGVFVDVEKVNSYTYKVRLSDIETVEPIGKEWIEEGDKYIASAPYGLYDKEGKQKCEEFIVYLPHTPVSELSEEFLTWLPDNYEGKDILSCYGLLNVATNYGFFHTPE